MMESCLFSAWGCHIIVYLYSHTTTNVGNFRCLLHYLVVSECLHQLGDVQEDVILRRGGRGEERRTWEEGSIDSLISMP